MSSPTRGAFIVIEGLDRSGKSTQAARLLDHIATDATARPEGSPPKAVLLKFPDRTTPIGKMIDAYLRSESDLDDHAIHLLFSANRWELAPTILAHLASGTTVIADRYTFSGIAFSAQKGSHLTYEWCKAPEIGLPAPDLTVFLDVQPEIAMQRGGYGEERYEKQEVQTRVRRVFEKIGKEMGPDRWAVINAGQDRDKVAKDIWDCVAAPLVSTDKPVARLWKSQEETS